MFFETQQSDIDTLTIQEKLDSVLERVMDRQSGSPISDIGLVERLRIQEKQKRLIVFCRRSSEMHACCMVFNNTMYDETIEDLKTELQKFFPGYFIKFVF